MNDPRPQRERLAQLVSDYDWLEGHCRKQPDLARHAGQIHMAAALARNVVGGALEGRPPEPLHFAVVGGAGSGKSTVANFLIGAVVAEANPQAGYTRHPTAYSFAPSTAWPSYLGFLGPLRLIDGKPANFDEDVYQIYPVKPIVSDDPLADDIVWDCPDMTTWASTGYVSRLMEVSALADVIVYVASDERYNDEVPTQYLQLLVKAGKAVVVVLTKMRETDAPALIEHFRKEVLAKIHTSGEIPPIPVVAIPHLSEAERNAPAASKHRVQLLNQILVLCPTAKEARARTVRNAVKYLETSADSLLEVARKDLGEYEAWKATVAAGKKTFEDRYRNEYLVGEPFRRFDRTKQQLLDLLEPPGAGQYAGRAFSILRLPYTTARDFLLGLGQKGEMPNLPEKSVLANAMTGWLEQLQAESLRRSEQHAVWREVARAFDAGLKQQAQDRFQGLARQFELKEGDELEQAGRSLVDQLTAHPGLLNAIRYGKIAVDVVAIIVVLWWTWVPSWYHILLLPVAVAASHTAAELIIRWRVESIRSAARTKRESLLDEQIATPLATWLDELPATGGTSLERLQIVLRRVPDELKAVTASVPSTGSA